MDLNYDKFGIYTLFNPFTVKKLATKNKANSRKILLTPTFVIRKPVESAEVILTTEAKMVLKPTTRPKYS